MATYTVQNTGAEIEARAAMNAQPDQMDQIETKQITPRESAAQSLKGSRVLTDTEPQTAAIEVVAERVVRAPSEVTHDLLSLHAKLDKTLSHSYVSSQKKHYTANIETTIKASPSITEATSVVYESAFTSPVRTIRLAEEQAIRSVPYSHYDVRRVSLAEEQTVRAAPFAQYASASYYNTPFTKPAAFLSHSAVYTTSSTSFKPGYDQDRLDNIVERILSSEQSYESIRSAPVRSSNEPVHVSVPFRSPNESVYVREVNLTRDYEAPCQYQKKTSVQKTSNHHFGKVENDRDSMILDYLENAVKKVEDEKKNHSEYYTAELVDDEEEKPRTKKVGKKQEATSPKKATKIADNKITDNKQALVPKGPYDQKKRDKITPEQAKKHFEVEDSIQDFDFGKNKK